MKKLLKRIVIEVYDYMPEVVVNKEVLQKVITEKTNGIDLIKAKKLVNKRNKEIEDYFGGNLSINKIKESQNGIK
jgi:hypothetical protein